MFISRSLRRNCRLKYLDLGSQLNIGLLSSKSLRYLMSPQMKRLDLSEVIFSPSQFEINLKEVANLPGLVQEAINSHEDDFEILNISNNNGSFKITVIS